MKIKLWNLGSIKEAEVDLRPLTVIIGPNNSNKTYIAYSIYGLWINQHDRLRLRDDILKKIEFTNQADHWSLKIDRRFYDVISEVIQSSASEFSGIKLQSFFQDSSGKIFEKTKFSIEISEDDIKTAIEKFLADTIEYRGSLASLGIKKIERSENNNEILFYWEKRDEEHHLPTDRILLLETQSGIAPAVIEKLLFVTWSGLIGWHKSTKFLSGKRLN